MPEIAVVYTTVGTLEAAEQLAEQVLAEALAVCVNIIPAATAVYRWQGKIEKTTEALLIFKTATHQVSFLQEGLQRKHPYEIPAILSAALSSSEAYYQYIHEG